MSSPGRCGAPPARRSCPLVLFPPARALTGSPRSGGKGGRVFPPTFGVVDCVASLNGLAQVFRRGGPRWDGRQAKTPRGRPLQSCALRIRMQPLGQAPPTQGGTWGLPETASPMGPPLPKTGRFLGGWPSLTASHSYNPLVRRVADPFRCRRRSCPVKGDSGVVPPFAVEDVEV